MIPSSTGTPTTINTQMNQDDPIIDLPEKVDFEGLGDLDEIEDSFNQGLEEIEANFRKLVTKTEQKFDKKHSFLKIIYNKLLKNYKFIEDEKTKISEQITHADYKVKKEKDNWEHEKKVINMHVKKDSEIVRLDLGGNLMKVSRETLTSVEGSLLEKMFSGKHNIRGKEQENKSVYLDRDFRTFEYMINYLRNGREVYPQFESKAEQDLFEKEIEYWGIKTFNEDFEERQLKSKLSPQLLEMMNSEPEKACMSAR